MKKTIMTIAIVLGLGLASYAQGGLFQRGNTPEQQGQPRDGANPGLPGHGLSDNQDAPLGSGIALLASLGGAYLITKKRREE